MALPNFEKTYNEIQSMKMTQGQWTPTISTIEGVDPTITYTTRRGNYKKIGNMVFVSFYLRGTIAEVNGTNNYALIKGLPFHVKSITMGENALTVGQAYNVVNENTEIQFAVLPDHIRIQTYHGASACTLKALPNGYFICAGSGWYEAA